MQEEDDDSRFTKRKDTRSLAHLYKTTMACVVTGLVGKGADPGSGDGTVWGQGGASCMRWLGKWSVGKG